MDITTVGGAIFITVLRLLHIVAGVLWVGLGVAVSMYFEPALQKAGVDRSKVLRALYGKTGFDKIMPAVALITTLAGLILYWQVSGQFSAGYMRSGQGIVLGIGVVFGLLAFGHGFGSLGPKSGKYIKLSNEAGDNPTPEQQEQLTTLEDKLARGGKVSMWLSVVALFFMAGARYIGPLIPMG